MMQVNTISSLQQIIGLDKIQVLKSNPTLKSDGVRYLGNDFIVEKSIISIQTQWNGKKIIRLKNVNIIDNAKKEVEIIQKKQEPKKEKNYAKNINQKADRID